MTRFYDWHTRRVVANGTALLRASLLTLALALGTSACSKTPQRPPDSALKQATKDERIERQEELDPQRRHLAPPPAYGNKVVLAENAYSSDKSF